MNIAVHLHREYDLAESLVGFEASMGVLDLVEREDGIDHWLNCSIGQQRYNLSCEGGGDCDLLLQRARAKDCTDDVETFAEDLVEVDFSLTTCHSTDEDEPAAQRHCFEAGGEIWTTSQIENDVKSAAGHALGKTRESR